MSAQSDKAKKRRMQRLSRLLPLLPLWPPVHCARLECWCCNQADAFLVAAPRSPVPRNEPSISSNSKPMQRSALPTKVLHGGSTHHSPCHHVTEFPFRDSNYHPQGSRQAAEASVRPPPVHEKSSFKPQPAGIWVATALHDSKMSRISFHSELQTQHHNVEPNVGDRPSRPQRV